MSETVVVTGSESGSDAADVAEAVGDAVADVAEELGDVVSDAVEDLTEVVETAVADDEPETVAAPVAVASAPEIDYDVLADKVAERLRPKEDVAEAETVDDGTHVEDDEPPSHNSFLYKKRL